MNNILLQIIIYFCKYYPHSAELSDARLTKMVYLSDWFSCLLRGKQITNIQWIFNHYGPYVDDVKVEVEHNPNLFQIETTLNFYGDYKKIISLKKEMCNQLQTSQFSIKLDPQTQEILKLVIEKTQKLYFNDFITYVYSTYPIIKNTKYNF